MRFRELFIPNKFLTELGALRFSDGQFDESSTRTPHEEMEQATLGFLYRPNINSGIRQLALFLIGKSIAIESKDKKTKEFLNAWIEKRKDIKNKMYDFIISALITGNAYFEKTFRTRMDGSLILDNIFPITDSVRVYRNLNAENEDEYWVYEVPTELKVYPFTNLQGELLQMKPKFWFINYVLASSTVFRRSVYGIAIHKKKIAHFKWGWSRDMIYGRSFLMACIDDIEIVREIIKNWSIISRYRALNSKIISIGDENNRASVDDINKFEEDLRMKKDSEHIILNKPHTMSSLSNVGEYDDMSNPIDFLRKDIGSGLVPNYLTPWNSDVNRATSEEVRQVFQAQLSMMQEDIIAFLNEEIIEELRMSYNWISEDATFVIESVDLEPRSEKLAYAGQLYNENIITLNEYRKLMGLPELPNGNRFQRDVVSQGPGEGPETGEITYDAQQDNSTAPEGVKLSILKPKAIESFVEKANENITEEDFFDTPTPEDELAEEMFKELNRVFMQAVDQYFGEIEKSKIRLDEAVPSATMAPRAVYQLDKTFSKFERSIDKIIADTGQKMLSIVIKAGGEKDKPISRSLEKELAKKAELLQKNFEAQLKQFSQKKIQDIRRKIIDGIAAGQSHAAIKQAIKKDINTYTRKENPHEFEIQRIVRTEIGKSTNLLKLLKWQAQGFKKYRWVTARDERVRPANESQRKVANKQPWQNHRARHNKVFDISLALSGKDIFPGGSLNEEKKNINCRCTAVLEIDE